MNWNDDVMFRNKKTIPGNKWKQTCFVAGILFIFGISSSYFIIVKVLPSFDTPPYEVSGADERKSEQAWMLLECMIIFYNDAQGQYPDGLRTLVKEGFLRELPVNYYHSRKGGNGIVNVFDEDKNDGDGWIENIDEKSGKMRGVNPHVGNYDDIFQKPLYVDECRAWYEKSGRKQFAATVIRIPEKTDGRKTLKHESTH